MVRNTFFPTYFIFDLRAVHDPDRARVLDTADTLAEARSAAVAQGGGCIYIHFGGRITDECLIEYVEVMEEH